MTAYEKILLTGFSSVAVALAVLHLMPWSAAAKVDLTVVGLLIIGGLPWLGGAIKKIEVPGGWKFEAQDIKEQISQQQEQISKQQKEVESQKAQAERTEELLKRQREMVDFIVKQSLHEHIYRHLRIINAMQQKNDGEYLLRSTDENMKRDLRELMNRNFIEFIDLDHLPPTTELVKSMRLPKRAKPMCSFGRESQVNVFGNSHGFAFSHSESFPGKALNRISLSLLRRPPQHHLNYLIEKRWRQTIEQGFLNKRETPVHLERKFATFGMRSHKEETRFVR
jgi:hypothetical protein